MTFIIILLALIIILQITSMGLNDSNSGVNIRNQNSINENIKIIIKNQEEIKNKEV